MIKNKCFSIRTFLLLIPLFLLTGAVRAESTPTDMIYVGSFSVEPCQDAKVLADWYSRLGLETKEFKGGYYAQLNTPSGPLFFGIHPKKADAPAKSSASVSIVLHVENLAARLVLLKSKGLLPDSTESDPSEGQFAHFHDPDGNQVTLWGK
jgi:predicted enzyme related to lactoylglutathione lyase